MKNIFLFILLLTFSYGEKNYHAEQKAIYKKLSDINKKTSGTSPLNSILNSTKYPNSKNAFNLKRLSILKKLNSNIDDAIFQKDLVLLSEYNALSKCLLFSKIYSDIDICKKSFLKTK